VLYVIFGQDGPQGLARRRSTRPAHLEYLRHLQREGRLILAGPRPNVDAENPGEAGYAGSLIVGEFANLADARAWADQDPYALSGVFQRVDVYPFLKVFPE
jgi:hypothetical protein